MGKVPNRSVLRAFFWLLKLGAFSNLLLLAQTFRPPLSGAPPQALIPARILLLVSAYRCLFPVRYKGYIVLHKSALSSIFLTRFLATGSEIALIYQLSYLLRTANTSNLAWLEILSWTMVVLVVLSQFFVWGAILGGRKIHYFYEELGWAAIYGLNAVGSGLLLLTQEPSGSLRLLLALNILFGVLYLPWQYFHLRSLRLAARKESRQAPATLKVLLSGLKGSLQIKNHSTDPAAWGGWMGLVWMGAYWAAVIPVWAFLILQLI